MVGPPGVSKTTAGIQWLASIRAGEDVFGRATTPTEIVFVSCDRSREEHDSHMHAMGYDPGIFHFHDQMHSKTSIERVVKACVHAYPDSRLIFIDGFARLVPDGKLSDYAIVSDFLCECTMWAQTYNVTILGCLHAGKSREGSSYGSPRDQVCGSVAWAGFSNLMIVMRLANPAEPDDPIRIVHVLTRAGMGDFNFKLIKDQDPDAGGRLLPYEDPIESDLLSMLDCWLTDQPFDRKFPTKELLAYAKDNTISQPWAEKWLRSQLENGRVQRVIKGIYQRIRTQ